ncbi:MAG: hypothetical protein ACJ74Y_10695 [Bryobacteraceae bacterium]
MKKHTATILPIMKSTWEEITPKKAAVFLEKNVTNRPLREATTTAYERDMRAGNWVSTHQGVAFNDRGELIDGQHRLTAVVRSGVTVRMLVTRGLPAVSGDTHTMDAVDRGATRSSQEFMDASFIDNVADFRDVPPIDLQKPKCL